MVRSLTAAVVGVILSLTNAAPLQTEFTIGQPVKTTSGTVVGHAAKTRAEVSEYLGIPFAQAPVNELRWAAPVRFSGDGEIQASSFSPYAPDDCAANFQSPTLAVNFGTDITESALKILIAMNQLGNEISEDCLTLNVWTKLQTGAKKPVMVWIYGGGFATGNSANPLYDGEIFADEEDVVLVSFNYRVSIFGFPGVPGVPGVEQNPGLLDQRLALEWVRDNIAGFGGDPDNITIFGESAGGASVDYYSYAYTEDPIVNGMIAQSGSVSSFSNPAPASNSDVWFKASAAVGCGDASTGAKASVDCMRGKSIKEILDVIGVDNPLQAVLGNFGPTVDDKTVFGDYDARNAAGKFIQKPFMNGNNINEAGLFVLLSRGGGVMVPENVWSSFNQAVFSCPVAKAAAARAAKDVTTFRYLFFGDFPNTRLMSVPQSSGAYHTSEIPILFNTAEMVTEEENTEPEKGLSEYMMSVWAQFARDPQGLTKAPFNLPTYLSKDESIIGLGASNNTDADLLSVSSYNMWCSAVEELVGKVPGGIAQALISVAGGGDLGIPGLSAADLPDLFLPDPPPARNQA